MELAQDEFIQPQEVEWLIEEIDISSSSSDFAGDQFTLDDDVIPEASYAFLLDSDVSMPDMTREIEPT